MKNNSKYASRDFPKEWNENYIPLASEDACRYCEYGNFFTNFKDGSAARPNVWCCGKKSGNFMNIHPDSCGHFKKLKDKS